MRTGPSYRPGLRRRGRKPGRSRRRGLAFGAVPENLVHERRIPPNLARRYRRLAAGQDRVVEQAEELVHPCEVVDPPAQEPTDRPPQRLGGLAPLAERRLDLGERAG